MMEVKNTEYNFIRKRMRRLEEAYKQSCDQNVRNVVKEITFCEIADHIDGFYERFEELFERCQMTSLMEIVNMTDTVLDTYRGKPLPPITTGQAKKIIKLKEKDLNNFVKGYNSAVSKGSLTYYSQRIDQKFIIVTQKDGDLVGAVMLLPKEQKNKECLCAFCRQFRKGDEIVFVTNVTSNKNGEYRTVGQYCCSDYGRCNAAIEDSTILEEFVSYGLVKKAK